MEGKDSRRVAHGERGPSEDGGDAQRGRALEAGSPIPEVEAGEEEEEEDEGGAEEGGHEGEEDEKEEEEEEEEEGAEGAQASGAEAQKPEDPGLHVDTDEAWGAGEAIRSPDDPMHPSEFAQLMVSRGMRVLWFRTRSAKPKWLQLSSRADRLQFFSVAKSSAVAATAKVVLSSLQGVALGKSRVFVSSPEGLRFPEGCCLSVQTSSSDFGVACETEMQCANLQRLLQRVVEAGAEGGKEPIPAALGVDTAALSAESRRRSDARRSWSPLSASPPARGRSGTDMSPTAGNRDFSRPRSASMLEQPSGQSRSFLRGLSLRK